MAKKKTISSLNSQTFTPERRKMLDETIKRFVTIQQGHGRTDVRRFTELAREHYDRKGVSFPEKSVFVTHSPTEFALTRAALEQFRFRHDDNVLSFDVYRSSNVSQTVLSMINATIRNGYNTNAHSIIVRSLSRELDKKDTQKKLAHAAVVHANSLSETACVSLCVRDTVSSMFAAKRAGFNFYLTGHLKFGQFNVDNMISASYMKLDLKLGDLGRNEMLSRYRELLSLVSYFDFTADYVVLCERPRKSSFDSRGNPHSATGPALQYSDGTRYFAVHGVLFTESELATSRNLSLEELIAWPDIGQRSALIMDTDAVALLKSCKNASLIDKTDQLGGYQLWELKLTNNWQSTHVLTYNSWSDSGKPYAKFVDPNTDRNNCLQAVATMRGISIRELTNAVRS